MLRSATFTIGLLLAGAAFVGFLLLGGVMAPPPYSVVVAVQDLPAYSTLNPSALGVDAERINGQVARTLVLREEIENYAGGFLLENVHAGEPLRKSAIVAPGNPQGLNRLALVMDDPDKVAFVLPVDAKTAPSQIAAGDWVDMVIGLAPGNITAGSNSTFSNLLAAPTIVSPIVSFGPTPSQVGRATPTIVANSSPSSLATSAGNVTPADMNLPADKVVIENVAVLAVRFQQVPNPAFTGSGGFAGSTDTTTTQPAYVQGDIQTVTVLIPRSSVELVSFGVDNGRVHLVLLPAKTAQAAHGAHSPTFGITFNDVLAWMMHERSLVNQNPNAASANLNPTPANIGSQPTVAAPSTQPTRQTPNQPRPTPIPPESIPTGLDLGALLGPLFCGVVFVAIAIGVIRFVRKRRREDVLA